MLKLQNISFGYTEEPFIRNLSLRIEKGANVSVIGASGCGKSTLLQIIYGLHHVEGRIFWKNKELLGPNFNLIPGEDFMKYLAQDFDLMPSISVADNVGKYLSNMYPRKKQQRIKQLLDLVEMAHMAKVKAKFLSGGEQQRVALARVLAKPPLVLLLDEPFSHIDHFRKNKLRRKLFSYLKKNEITCLVATHDSTDALSFADKTLAMKSGKIVSEGSPQEIYEHPINGYVASLFGEVNEMPAHLFRSKEKGRKKIILYPHEIKLTNHSKLEVNVKGSFFKGNGYFIEADLEGYSLLFEHREQLEEGKKVFVDVPETLIQSRLSRK